MRLALRAARTTATTVLSLGVAAVSAATPVLDGRIPLPGSRGRLDHLAVDAEGGRLYVADLGGNATDVVDLNAGSLIARLEGQREPQGIVYVAASRQLLVANGASGSVESYVQDKRAATIGGLPDADNVRLDPQSGLMYVGYGSGLAVVDPRPLRVVERFGLPGHPDEPHHRLFVATRRPARLQVYDTATGRRVSELPLCGDADDLFFDAARRQLYAVCGEGQVAIFSQRDPDRYEVVLKVATAPGARTGLFVPGLDKLFVAAPARDGRPAEILVYRLQ